MGSRVAILAVLAVLGGAAPAGAATATFGADLANLPANNDPAATCAVSVRSDAPVGSPSCMWSYYAGYPNGLGAPQTGTVTAIRVKVGAITGPMRVNVIRFLYRNGATPSEATSAGPYLQAYGPRFTPAADAVTTVPVNLPVVAQPTPPLGDTQTIQTLDYLALEVEAPNVPLPLYSDPGALNWPVYPGPSVAGVEAPSFNPLPSYTRVGAGVLMSADWTDEVPGGSGAPGGGGGAPGGGGGAPGGGAGPGGGGGAPPGGGPPSPAIGVAGRGVAPVRAGVARVPLVCRVVDCSGTLTLQNGGAAGKLVALARRPRKLGTARFSGTAGKSVVAKVRLNRTGRALLKRKRRVKVTGVVRFTSGGAGQPQVLKVTLKR